MVNYVKGFEEECGVGSSGEMVDSWVCEGKVANELDLQVWQAGENL